MAQHDVGTNLTLRPLELIRAAACMLARTVPLKLVFRDGAPRCTSLPYREAWLNEVARMSPSGHPLVDNHGAGLCQRHVAPRCTSLLDCKAWQNEVQHEEGAQLREHRFSPKCKVPLKVVRTACFLLVSSSCCLSSCCLSSILIVSSRGLGGRSNFPERQSTF